MKAVDVRTDAEKFADQAASRFRAAIANTAFDEDHDGSVDVRWAYVGLMLQAFHDRLKRIEEKLGIDDGDRTKAG